MCLVDGGKSDFEETGQCLNAFFPPKLNMYMLSGAKKITLLKYFTVLDFSVSASCVLM